MEKGLYFISDKKEELLYTVITQQKSDRPPWLLTLCNQAFRLRRNQSSLRAVSSSLLPHSLCSVRLQADVLPFLPGNSPLTLTETLLFLQKDLHQPIARRGESREKGCRFLYGSSRFILFPRTQVKGNAGSARLSLLPEHVVSSHRHMSQPFHCLQGAGSAQGRGSHLQGKEERAKSRLTSTDRGSWFTERGLILQLLLWGHLGHADWQHTFPSTNTRLLAVLHRLSVQMAEAGCAGVLRCRITCC